jgi:hypothetical protein
MEELRRSNAADLPQDADKMRIINGVCEAQVA